MENPASLLRRLNPYCARAMEGAASLCQTRTHAEILPEHWLLTLPEQGEDHQRGDILSLRRKNNPILVGEPGVGKTALTAACLLPDTGARNVNSLLNQQILPVLSQQLLTHMAAKQKPGRTP